STLRLLCSYISLLSPFLSSIVRPLPRSTLFPYTTLFRSLTWRGASRAPRETCARCSPTGSPAASGISGTRKPLATLSVSTWRRRSEEHTSELQSRENLVCRLLLEKKKKKNKNKRRTRKK